MTEEISYEDLAEFIARYLYDHFHEPEKKIDGTVVWNVDNMCNSSLQIATGVLNRLDILAAIDPIGRRNVFTVGPKHFRRLALHNRNQGGGFDALILAIICLDTYHPNQKQIVDLMIRMGLYSTDDDTTATMSKPVRTAKYDRYNRLYDDWPSLLKA